MRAEDLRLTRDAEDEVGDEDDTTIAPEESQPKPDAVDLTLEDGANEDNAIDLTM